MLLFNDGAYGNVKRMQQNKFGDDRTIASTLTNPDHQAMAASMGVRPERIDSPAGIEAALGRALAHDGPALVEVMVGEMPDPWPLLQPARIRGEIPG